MQYCPHCMKTAAGSGSCPNCGGDMSWTGQKGIDLPVGTVLSGGNGLRTYQIGAARGKGGFGITYVALETNSGRRMAVKEYFPTRCAFRGGNGVDVQAMTGQEEAFRSGMNSFLEEGKMLLSQDDLPCVVHVIDYFQANGTAYLVMEYLDGVALHTQMTRMGGRIPVDELMPRLALLMRDIGQLHKRGVIHRDISPDNIMWMPDGLKLLDFGSARSMESGKSMTVLMKQGFSPIEQYRSSGQGAYTDIYALAATIYYCVTGVIPPSSQDRLGDDTLQSPIALGAALTVQQETALLWALSIQPNGRPQSMEEFAAMLYKEGPAPAPVRPVQTGGSFVAPAPVRPVQTGGPYVAPAPAGPVQTGGPYTAPQGYRPQSERPPQVPPQPAAGQNPGYPYGQSYPGQVAGSGQPARQVPPQPVTERSLGYSYGQSYPGQPVGPGPGQSGGRKKLPVFIGIGAAAAVVVAVIIGVIVWMGGSKENTAENSERPDQSTAPSFSTRPARTPEPAHSDAPTQNIVTGVTDDGFLYEIIDRNNAVLTGYEGTSYISELPDYVEDVPVTAIADNAFAGALIDECVILPRWLEAIGGNAFRGCSDLEYLVTYSEVATESTTFSGCDNLWFVISFDESTSGLVLPSGTHLFYAGMETGIGPLADAYFPQDGLLIGETEDETYILLDVQPGTTYVDLEDVIWICPGALDNLGDSSTVRLGDDTLYSYETFLNVYHRNCTLSAPDGVLSDMWLLSCVSAYNINAGRLSGVARIEPDERLMQAAMTRAKELAEDYSTHTRPQNKGSWITVLHEQGYDSGYAAQSAGHDKDDYQKMWEEAADYMAEKYTAAVAEGDYAGQYYIRIGMAAAPQSDGKYAWCGFVMIP